MPRPRGQRSHDYDEKRRALLVSIRARLLDREAGIASLREIAAGAGVTYPTIRHYFGTREGLIDALLADWLAAGQPYLEQMRRPSLPFAESMREALDSVHAGFAVGLGQIHAIGLIEGLHHPRLGPAYLDRLLDPTIDALADRLAAHVERGEMMPTEPKFAALAFLSPLVLAYLHQDQLGGRSGREFAIETFGDVHLAAFIRAWRSDRP